MTLQGVVMLEGTSSSQCPSLRASYRVKSESKSKWTAATKQLKCVCVLLPKIFPNCMQLGSHHEDMNHWHQSQDSGSKLLKTRYKKSFSLTNTFHTGVNSSNTTQTRCNTRHSHSPVRRDTHGHTLPQTQ